eukprot:2775899-Rhodomonas_salina.4
MGPAAHLIGIAVDLGHRRIQCCQEVFGNLRALASPKVGSVTGGNRQGISRGCQWRASSLAFTSRKKSCWLHAPLVWNAW